MSETALNCIVQRMKNQFGVALTKVHQLTSADHKHDKCIWLNHFLLKNFTIMICHQD